LTWSSQAAAVFQKPLAKALPRAAAVALAEPGASNDENAALALNATGSATVERSHTSCQSYRFPDPWVPSADHVGQD
jgi:hypothetical protein